MGRDVEPRALRIPLMELVRTIAALLAMISTPHVVTDGTINVTLPPGWHSETIYGGVGSNPTGLPVTIVSNRSLPEITTCDQQLPAAPRQIVISISDYRAADPSQRWRVSTSLGRNAGHQAAARIISSITPRE